MQKNEQDAFWDSVDERDHINTVRAYDDQFSPKNPVPSLPGNRDKEMWTLVTILCLKSKGQIVRSDVASSRQRIRSQLLGQWDADSRPFAEEEVRQLRGIMIHKDGDANDGNRESAEVSAEAHVHGRE